MRSQDQIGSTESFEETGFIKSQAQPVNDRDHLTFNEAADWLRCSARTLQRLLETGAGPPVIRISERRLIFRKGDLQKWLAQRTAGNHEYNKTARRRSRRSVTVASSETT